MEQTKNIEHGARVHHPYSPSSLQAREACPCFDPEQSDDANRLRAAVRGTLQHEGVELWVGEGKDDLRLNDIEAAAVKDCVSYARMVLDKAGKGARLVTEIYVPIDSLKVLGRGSDNRVRHFVGTTAGYLDLAILNADCTEADLLDWKFGAWDVEPAETNRQFHAYLLGLLKLYPTLRKVRVHIVMPHRDELDKHEFNRSEFPGLLLEIKTIVSRAVNVRTFAGDTAKIDWAKANPTVSGCLFCAHKGHCDKLAEVALSLGKKFAPLQVPADITPSTIRDPKNAGLGVQVASVVKAWAEAYRAQATLKTVETKDFVPEGYTLVKSVKRQIVDKSKLLEVARQFLSPQEIEAALEVTLGPLDDAVSTKAPRGSKQDAVDTFSELLKQAEAIKDGDPIYSLRLAKKPKTETEKGKKDEQGIVQKRSGSGKPGPDVSATGGFEL
jgi:hypothetical protein